MPAPGTAPAPAARGKATAAPREVLLVRSAAQATVLLKPLRLELLRLMDQPRTCPELARLLRTTPQRIYYHVKALERARLVTRVGERRVRGVVEGFYQAAARSYRLAENLVRRLGGAEIARDQSSLAVLAGHAERLLEDVARLAEASAGGERVPSLSLATDIVLADEDRREAFLTELQAAFRALAERFGARGDADTPGQVFRLNLTCYPTAPMGEAA